jgi:hypothetical protein
MRLAMDLNEATLTMCHLILAERTAREALDLSSPPDRELQENLRVIQGNLVEFGNRLAAMPNFFDVMEPWLITVIGRQGISRESMEEVAKSNDREDLVARAGALACSVVGYLRSQGFIIRDVSAGEDGWDVCVRCTDKLSRSLCFDLHQRFAQAISLNLLNVSRRFGGNYLPGLYTWKDARRLLNNFGEQAG